MDSDLVIDSFEVWNFKSIRYSGKIKLRKLNLFLGPNSSGKTSILQSLLLLKQTFESEEPSAPLQLNGQYLQLGEYKDFIHKKNISLPFRIKFNLIDKLSKSEFTCKVCNKKYDEKQKTWYLKHLEKDHNHYWISNRKKLILEEPSSPSYSIEIEYAFNNTTKSIILKQLMLTGDLFFYGADFSSMTYKNLGRKNFSINVTNKNNLSIFQSKTKIRSSEIVRPNSFFYDILRDYLGYAYYEYLNFNNWKLNEEVALINRDLTNTLNTIKTRRLREGSEKILVAQKNTSNSPESIPRVMDSFYPAKLESHEENLAIAFLARFSRIASKMEDIINELTHFCGEIEHLGPLRNRPERIYFSTGGNPHKVGDRGEFTQELILRQTELGNAKLTEEINSWLKKIHIDCSVKISKLGVGGLYQLIIQDNKLRVNLNDVGFGISQILPILTATINSYIKSKDKPLPRLFLPRYRRVRFNSLIVIEQPEIHLNPSIQAELGDFFIKLTENQTQFFIETHSEHILGRIQRRIVDGTLKSNQDVIIYFVNKDRNESKIQEIRILPDGSFDNWPEGFFQDDFNESIEILKSSLLKSFKKDA